MKPTIGDTVLLHLAQGDQIIDRPATVVNVYSIELAPAVGDKPAKLATACTLVGSIDRFRDSITPPPGSWCDGISISVQNAVEGEDAGEWSPKK